MMKMFGSGSVGAKCFLLNENENCNQTKMQNPKIYRETLNWRNGMQENLV